MASIPTRADLLAAVQQSPDAVAIHDREAWLDLYAADGQVNDPVGSRPHVGRDAIGHFYDTFIAPNTIVFAIDHDIVDGLTVVRDLTVRTTMSTGVELNVPMHLRYDLVDDGGLLKISGLYAHWELPSMITQLAKAGTAGVGASAKLTPQLLSNQGLGGALGFMQGFRRIGKRGKRAAEEFFRAVRDGNVARAESLVEADLRVDLSGTESASVAEFVSGTTALSWTKVLASGQTVTVSLQRNGVRAVALVEFARKGARITRVRLFADR